MRARNPERKEAELTVKKKISWVILSLVLLVTLVLASCGPAATTTPVTGTPTTGTPTTVTPAAKTETVILKKLDGSTVKKEMEVPQYGGWVNAIPNWTVNGVDPANSGTIVDPKLMLTHDVLLAHDWYRGPSGTGEFGCTCYEITQDYFGGCIAESWEQPDLGTLIITLKKGVHFQNKPPANGREVTANDVVYCLNRCVNLPACAKCYAPPTAAEEDKWRATAIDKYTVEFKMPTSAQGYFAWYAVPLELYIYPPECVDAGINDWKNSCGTGPYMLTDFVEGSTATLKRNPDFYLNDPFFPNNKLPYPDGVNILYIADQATRVASLRTGKVDRVYAMPREQAVNLLKTNPELKYVKVREMSSSICVFNNKVKPFDDIRVRKALWMAIDFQALANIFGGDADIFGWPVQVGKAAYVPLEDMPADVQELYSHNVAKAKQLLADAGYPNGFKTKALWDAEWGVESMVPAIQSMWAQIGVDCALQQVDIGVMRTQMYALSYGDIAFYGAGNARPWGSTTAYYAGGVYDWGNIGDPTPAKMYDEAQQTADVSKQYAELKDMYKYIVEHAFWPGLLVRHAWTFWQPWLKGYSGEDVATLAFADNSVYRYVWIDQSLKKEMGK
jgi:peptide/nickel transport system substrate-binding protein